LTAADLEAVVKRLEDETVLWQAFLRTYRNIRDQLSRQMLEDGLPLEWFDVLVHLAEAPDGRLRQNELRQRVMLSESGVSRMLARMSKAGLIAQLPVPEDRRSVSLTLTAAGKAALRKVTPTHLDLVASLFSDRLTPTRSKQLQQILAALTADAPDGNR